MRFSPLLFLLLIFSSSFSQKNESQITVPDYCQEKFWIALPWRKDVADSIPPGCAIPENQQLAKMDVFFIHPTVYLSGKGWNADLNDEAVNKKADNCIKFQASTFNACARVFAPRYRQAVLRSFFGNSEGPAALDFAYADVKAAFEHYLKYWNNGRPLIIAGHSQGAHHAARLLKDFFDGKDLQKQLVAAYPIGMPLKKKEFSYIPLADSATQTGCFITWNSFLWGSKFIGRAKEYQNSACVNPLTWKTDESYAPCSFNVGGLPYNYRRIDKEVCDAQNHEGMLWLHAPFPSGYYIMGSSYHLCDYNLFYMNIRQNAMDRAESFLKK